MFIQRFSYAIVFMANDDAVRVIAIAHTSRRPNYWLDRIH